METGPVTLLTDVDASSEVLQNFSEQLFYRAPRRLPS